MTHLVDSSILTDERYPHVTLGSIGSKLAKSGQVPSEVVAAFGYLDGHTFTQEALYQGYLAKDESGMLHPTDKGLRAGIAALERTDAKGASFTSFVLSPEDASALIDEMVAFIRESRTEIDVIVLASSQASGYRKVIGYEQGRNRYVQLGAPAAKGGSSLLLPSDVIVEAGGTKRAIEPFDVVRVPLARRAPQGHRREFVEVDVSRGITWTRRATPQEIGSLMGDEAMLSVKYLFFNKYRAVVEGVLQRRANHSIELAAVRNMRLYRFVSDQGVVFTRADFTYVPQGKNAPVAYQGLTVHDPNYQDLQTDVMVPEARIVATLTPLYNGYAYKTIEHVLPVGSIAMR